MKTARNPPVTRHCRKKPSRWLKQWILETQKHRCLACDKKLGEVEFDHVVPLGLTGSNAPDNWAALCPTCHRTKTRADLRRIAKAKRQQRYHETGRSRAARPQAPGLGNVKGFDITKRRHLNGVVTPRCQCSVCLSRGAIADD